MTINTTDILIIGGGPAGSTFGNLAAQQGWQVTLFEKEKHPRFHIGESLNSRGECRFLAQVTYDL